MSFQGILRFFGGVILAGILLALILPFVGVPSSHYLPPAWVYNRATGVTRGYVNGKYYVDSSNPFKIGSINYYLNYTFKAPAPGPAGAPGPKQIYTGTIRVDQALYDQTGQAQEQGGTKPAAHQVIPEPDYAVHVKYETTYPDISGLTDSWALTYENGRSIGPGSNTLSGWIIWIFVAIFLGYFMAMLLGRFMAREEI